MDLPECPPGAEGYEDSFTLKPEKPEIEKDAKWAANVRERIQELKLEILKEDGGGERPMVEMVEEDPNGGAATFICYPCGVTCKGEILLDSHLLGKKHNSKISIKRFYTKSIYEEHPYILKKKEAEKSENANTDNKGDSDRLNKPFAELEERFASFRDIPCALQKKLDEIKAPMIGLDYIVEHPPEREHHEPRYFCVLCRKNGHPKTIITHIGSFWHKLNYVSRHFKKAFAIVTKCGAIGKTGPGGVARETVGVLLTRLAQRVEDELGRRKPLRLEVHDTEALKEDFFTWIMQSEHISEENGKSYEEVIDLDLISSLEKSSTKEDWKDFYSKQKEIDDKKDAEKDQGKREKREKSTESLSDISGDEAPRGAPLSFRGRRYIPYEPSKDRRSSPPPFKHRWVSRVLQVRQDKKLAPNYAHKVKLTEEQTMKAVQQAKTMLTYHDKHPEKHPLYPEEWKKFWNRRYKELQAEGKDAVKYDYKPEWIVYWTKRMKGIYDEELRNRITEIYNRFGLTPPSTSTLTRLVEGRARSPSPRRAPPRPREPSPRRPFYPRHREPSPRRRELSPRRREPSPRRREPSPRRRELSPRRHERLPSPRRQPLFPSQARVSPRRYSPPPARRMSPPPRRASPLPRRVSPLPRRVSPLPRRVSPPPRRVSPPPRRASPPRRRASPPPRTRSRSPIFRHLSPRRSASPLSRREQQLRDRNRSPAPVPPPKMETVEISDEELKTDGLSDWDSPTEMDSPRNSPRGSVRSSALSSIRSSARKTVRSRSRSVGGGGGGGLTGAGDADGGVIGTLRLLVALEEHLGPSLGPRVLELLTEALRLERLSPSGSEALLERGAAQALLETAKEKLKGAAQAGLVGACALPAARACVVRVAALLHEARRRPAPAHSHTQPPDREEIARQMAAALVAQGKTDVSGAELQQLVDAVVAAAEAKRAAPAPAPPPAPATPALQLLRAAYDEPPATDAMDGLSDSDLETLLKNFSDLSADEQQSLVAYLRRLEAGDPRRVERLRSFVGDAMPSTAARKSAEPAAAQAAPAPVASVAATAQNDSDDDDYTVEDVVRTATKKVLEEQQKQELEFVTRSLEAKSQTAATPSAADVLKLLANIAPAAAPAAPLAQPSMSQQSLDILPQQNFNQIPQDQMQVSHDMTPPESYGNVPMDSFNNTPQQIYNHPQQQFSNNLEQGYNNQQQQFNQSRQNVPFNSQQNQFSNSQLPINSGPPQQYNTNMSNNQQRFTSPQDAPLQFNNGQQQSFNESQQYNNAPQPLMSTVYNPPQQFTKPQQQYNNQQQQFDKPQQQFNNQQQQFNNPQQQFNKPQQQFNNPQQQFNNPQQQSFNAPRQQFNNGPRPQFNNAQQSNNWQPQNKPRQNNPRPNLQNNNNSGRGRGQGGRGGARGRGRGVERVLTRFPRSGF